MKIIEAEQGTLEWQKYRLARITGTKLSDVMGTPKARKKLIACLIGEEGTEQSKSIRPTAEMERGSAEEIFAVKAFEKKFKKKVESVGICISDEFDWLAYSPDGLIKDKKGKYSEGIEVKNPDSSTVILYRLGEGLCALGIPDDYKWQVVNAFLVNEDLQKLYFVIHDARFIEEGHKMHVVAIERSNPDLQDLMRHAKESLALFRKDWLECRDIVLPNNF